MRIRNLVPQWWQCRFIFSVSLDTHICLGDLILITLDQGTQ